MLSDIKYIGVGEVYASQLLFCGLLLIISHMNSKQSQKNQIWKLFEVAPHSHGEVHCGQQAQHGADNQSCGVPVIHHGREEDSSLGEQTQSAVSNEVWLPEMEG